MTNCCCLTVLVYKSCYSDNDNFKMKNVNVMSKLQRCLVS